MIDYAGIILNRSSHIIHHENIVYDCSYSYYPCMLYMYDLWILLYVIDTYTSFSTFVHSLRKRMLGNGKHAIAKDSRSTGPGRRNLDCEAKPLLVRNSRNCHEPPLRVHLNQVIIKSMQLRWEIEKSRRSIVFTYYVIYIGQWWAVGAASLCGPFLL